MSDRLSGNALARILTEKCARNSNLNNRHYFRPDPECEIELTCGWCGLELDFTTYTCNRAEQTAVATGVAIATTPPKPTEPEPDQPAPLWLDKSFHLSTCFKLPERSGFIGAHLFWYYVDSTLDARVPNLETEGTMRVRIPDLHREELATNPPDRLETISEASGIKRLYINTDAVPPRLYGSLQEWAAVHMERAAWFNLRKLLAGKFKPEHQAEALAEIENQLSKVPPVTARTKVPRVIFAKLEEWKRAPEGHAWQPL